MADRPQVVGSLVENTEVDAASYIWDNWVAAGVLSGRLSQIDLQAVFGTAANLEIVYSSSSDGASPFATAIFNANVNLVAGGIYGFTVLAKASSYINFQPDATTNIDIFYAVQKDVWR